VRIPTLEVGPLYLLRAAGAMVISAAIVGSFWAWVVREVLNPGFILAVFFGLGIGWVISESVSFATNHKRGVPLQMIAGIGGIVALLIRNIVLADTLLIGGDEVGYITAGAAALFAASRLKLW
jgi:hypothetical protein